MQDCKHVVMYNYETVEQKIMFYVSLIQVTSINNVQNSKTVITIILYK